MTNDINALITLVSDTISDLFAISYFKSIILYCICLSIVFIAFKIIKKLKVGVFYEKNI